MAVQAEIVESQIDTNGLAAKVSADRNGATLVFLGVTRDHHDGRGVSYLEYECYREMALKELENVAQKTAQKHGVEHVYVVHRIGRVDIGEVSLGVAVSSPHRVQAFEASQDLVNLLKQDVPIWKREYFSDGSVGWVEGCEIKPASE